MTIFFVNILCETSGFEEKSFQKSSHVILPLFSTCANGEAGGAVFTLNWHSRILYFYLILPKKVQFWSISVFQHFAYPNFSQIKVMKLVVFFCQINLGELWSFGTTVISTGLILMTGSSLSKIALSLASKWQSMDSPLGLVPSQVL